MCLAKTPHRLIHAALRTTKARSVRAAQVKRCLRATSRAMAPNASANWVSDDVVIVRARSSFLCRPTPGLPSARFKQLASRFVIRAEENPATGLLAKNPAATYTAEGHIINGSRPGWASQFISTTNDLSVAESWAARSGNRIVGINLRGVTGNILDVSGGLVCAASPLETSPQRHPRF